MLNKTKTYKFNERELIFGDNNKSKIDYAQYIVLTMILMSDVYAAEFIANAPKNESIFTVILRFLQLH